MKKYVEQYKKLPVQMRATLWFMICSFLQRGISVITTPIFTRIMTTNEYGQFSIFNSWMLIVAPIVSLRLSEDVYAQGLVRFEEDRNRFSSTLQGLTLMLIAVGTAVYLVDSAFWNQLFSLTKPEMLAMMVMIWTTSVFSFWSMNQRIDFHYRRIIICTLLLAVFQPVISIIFMLKSSNKVLARILGMTIVQIVICAWMFVEMLIKGKHFYSQKYWRYALGFNIPLLPHYLSMNVLNSSDRIMIGAIVGENEVGIYNLAYSISQIMTIFNTALLQTIEPWIYRKLKLNRTSEIARVAYICFFGIAGLNVLLIMVAPEVIRFFAPVAYREAIWTIPSVTLSVFFMFLYTFFATFEFYYEKTKYVVGATIGGALLNIFLNYIFIPMFGYVAAGYTTLISYIVFAILHYYFMRKICKEYLNDIHPYNPKIIIGIAIGSILLGFGFMATYENTRIRYTLIVLLAIVLICLRKKIMRAANLLMCIKSKR